MNFVEGQRYRIWFAGDDPNHAGWLFTYIRRHPPAEQGGPAEHCFHDEGQVEMSISDEVLQQCRVQVAA